MLEVTLSYRAPLLLPSLPPGMTLPTPKPSQIEMTMNRLIPIPDAPVFCATLADKEDHLAELDRNKPEDKKKLFDCTAELQKLTESSVGKRRSFIKQLKSVFRTLAEFDLDGFGQFSVAEDALPMPLFNQASVVLLPIPELVSVSQLVWYVLNSL